MRRSASSSCRARRTVEDRDLDSKELEIERQRARRGRQWAMDCQTETVSKIGFELLFAKRKRVRERQNDRHLGRERDVERAQERRRATHERYSGRGQEKEREEGV